MAKKTVTSKGSPSFFSRLFGAKETVVHKETTAHRPYQAIAIYHGVRACEAAKKFSEHRFLTKDAPPLPLAGCSLASTCECRYLKYKDRRGTQRRLVDFGAPARIFTAEDRRKYNGRRTTD